MEYIRDIQGMHIVHIQLPAKNQKPKLTPANDYDTIVYTKLGQVTSRTHDKLSKSCGHNAVRSTSPGTESAASDSHRQFCVSACSNFQITRAGLVSLPFLPQWDHSRCSIQANCSAAVTAKTSLTSPQKAFIFIIKKYIYRIKVPKK